MDNLSRILKLAQTQNDLYKFAHSGDWIAKALAIPNTYSRYDRTNNIASIAYQLTKQQRLHDKYLPVAFLTKHNSQLQNRNLFDSVTRIAEQNRRMEAGLSGINRMLRYQPQINAVLNSKRFIDFYIGRTLSTALVDDDEQEVEVVEKIQEISADVFNSIEENGFVTKDDLQHFMNDVVFVINQKIETLKDKKNDKKVKHWEFIKNSLVSLIISLAFWLIPSPTVPSSLTKEDLEKTQRENLKEFSSLLNKSKVYRTLNKNFKLRQLPRFSSVKLILLKKGFKLEVLNSNSTWAYVTATDADGYPVNGWIPKNVLSR